MGKQSADLRVTNRTNSKVEPSKEAEKVHKPTHSIRIPLLHVMDLEAILVNVSSTDQKTNQLVHQVSPHRRNCEYQLTECIVNAPLNDNPMILSRNKPNDMPVRVVCRLESIEENELPDLLVPLCRRAEQSVRILESEDFKRVVDFIRHGPSRKTVVNQQSRSNAFLKSRSSRRSKDDSSVRRLRNANNKRRLLNWLSNALPPGPEPQKVLSESDRQVAELVRHTV